MSQNATVVRKRDPAVSHLDADAQPPDEQSLPDIYSFFCIRGRATKTVIRTPQTIMPQGRTATAGLPNGIPAFLAPLTPIPPCGATF